MEPKLKEYAANIVGQSQYFNPAQLASKINPETGRIEIVPRSTLDPTKDQIINENVQEPLIEYGGAANAIQTFGRALTNTTTLGGYALLTDRFRTPEEKRAIKRREDFHGAAEFLGTAAGYLLPVIGEVRALGAAGKAIGKLATIPNLGNIAAKELFKAETTSAGKLMTMASIDGLAAGFTQGANEASLDDFSQESIDAWAASTALGLGTGIAFGGVLSSIAPLTKAAKNVIGRSTGELGKGPVKFDPASQWIGTQNVRQQAAQNRSDFAKVFNEYSPLFNKPLTEMTTEEIADRNFFKMYSAFMAKNEGASNAFFEEGAENWTQHFEAAKNLNRLEREYGTGRPVAAPLINLGDTVNNSIEQFATFRQEATKLRKTFDPATLDTTLGQDAQFNLASKVVDGDTSFFNTMQNQLRDILDPERTLQRASEEYFAKWGKLPDERQLLEAVRSQKTGYDKTYVEDMLAAFANAGKAQGLISSTERFTAEELQKITTLEKEFERSLKAVKLNESQRKSLKLDFFRQHGIDLEKLPANFMQKSNIAPSQIWRFVEEVSANVDKVRYAKEKLSPQEMALFKSIKESLKEIYKNFGPDGKKVLQIRDALNAVSVAQKELKASLKAPAKRMTALGKELETIDIDKWRQLASKNKSTGRYSLRDVEPALLKYYAALEENTGAITEALGMPESELTGAFRTSGENAFKRYKDAQAISNNSVNRWYEFQESTIASSARTGKKKSLALGTSPTTRIIRGTEDLIFPGESRFAAIQFGRLLIETTLKLLSKMENPATFDEFLELRVKALHQSQTIAQATKTRIGKVTSSLFKATGPTAMAIGKTIPYAAAMTTKDGRDKIQKDYRKIINHLDKIQQNPGEVTKLAYHYEPLRYITKDGDSKTTSKVLNTLGSLMSSIPSGPPVIEGGGYPSLIEQAQFNDKMIAMAQPDIMLDMIASGSPTQEMLDIFKNSWPQYWNTALKEVQGRLLSNVTLSLKPRTRIMSLFGIKTAVMPVPGAAPYSAIAPPPQEMGDQETSAMAKVRISGPNKLDANKQVGLFTSQGAP